MLASKKSVRATFKIAAIYVFALSTAVACSKFESAQTTAIRGSVVPTSAAAPGSVVPAASATTVLINSLQRTNNGAHDPVAIAVYNWSFKMSMTHGATKLDFLLTPKFDPSESTVAEGEYTVETIRYVGQVVCADQECRNVATLLTVANSKDNSTYQMAQYWDFSLSTTAPLKTLTGTNFRNAKDAYFGLTTELLP